MAAAQGATKGATTARPAAQKTARPATTSGTSASAELPAGFTRAAFDFFADLAANQNREWFLENKQRYERDVRAPLEALVASVAFGLAVHDIPLTADPKKAIFRIHRDVRFSKDKRPYKTNAGAVLTRGGEKNSPGLLYMHVSADGAFTAAGFYAPEPPQLAALRARIAAKQKDWLALEATLAKRGLVLSTDDAAVRLPREFDADAVADVAAALRLKSLIVRRPISLAELQSPDLAGTIIKFAEAALPLLTFGWAALDAARS